MLASFVGRLDPERALLDRLHLERSVAQRVLGWAAMACGEGNMSKALTEDAAEEERSLEVLAHSLASEAVLQQGQHQSDSAVMEEVEL